MENQKDLAGLELEKAEFGLDNLKASWPEVEESGLLKAMSDPLFKRSDSLRSSLGKGIASDLSPDDPDLVRAKIENDRLEKEAKNELI